MISKLFLLIKKEIKLMLKIFVWGTPLLLLSLGFSIIPCGTIQLICLTLSIYINRGALSKVSDTEEDQRRIRSEVVASAIILMTSVPLIMTVVSFVKQYLSIVGTINPLFFVVAIVLQTLPWLHYRLIKNNTGEDIVPSVQIFTNTVNTACLLSAIVFMAIELEFINKLSTDNGVSPVTNHEVTRLHHISP